MKKMVKFAGIDANDIEEDDRVMTSMIANEEAYVLSRRTYLQNTYIAEKMKDPDLLIHNFCLIVGAPFDDYMWLCNEIDKGDLK